LKEVDSPVSFRYWFKNAIRGERVVYYTGFLLRDREILCRNGLHSDNFPDTIKAAISAWNAYRDGGVKLFQRKRGDFEYEYIAIKV
jgi:hypothetical protein